MKNRQSLFIYDRREMMVIILLLLMISVFTFTLGIHLGKRIGSKSGGIELGDTSLVATLPDQIPNRQELTEQGKGAQFAVEETIHKELREEVFRSGIKLDTPRQVNLPEKPKKSNAGATTLRTPSSEAQPRSPSESSSPSKKEKFSLQIGSFPTLDEAKKQLAALNQNDLKPFLREAEIKGKGKWYRLYTGGFLTRSEAEKAGEQYRSRHMITSFVVSKLSD